MGRGGSALVVLLGSIGSLGAAGLPPAGPHPDRTDAVPVLVRSLSSPVADAAMRGEADRVRALLQDGADVNQPQGDGMTALHWAAELGDAPLALLLLEAGADPAATTRLGGYTPLHLASRSGLAPVVEALLRRGAAAGQTTGSGAVALHLASAAGNPEAVKLLLSAGSDPNAREATAGQTPLIFAAARNRAEVIRELLGAGADPALATRVVDIPALATADRAGRQARNRSLATQRTTSGDDPRWRPEPDQLQEAVLAGRVAAEEAMGRAATEAAATGAEGEVVGYTGQVGTQGGLTPLLYAAREGHREAALALLEGGADLNQVSLGDRTSPLLMATLNGELDLALVLLERGADPNLASDAGAAPLYAAINVQWAPRSRYPQPRAHEQQAITYLELMEALLEKGADPDARLTRHLWYLSFTFDLLDVDMRGSTPFWRAAYATDVEAMRLLVRHGADPHVATIRPADRPRRGRVAGEDPSGLPPIPEGGPGVFPIHAASGVGYGEGYAANAHRHVPDGWLPAVRYLVEELGVDVNLRDHNGYNAIHHAAARGDNALIEYLVRRGGDVTAVSRAGQTTADMANGPVQRISPFRDTVALLERLGSHNNQRCLSC